MFDSIIRFFKNPYYILFTAIGIIYLAFMQIDVMDVDAAQYASISREMLETGNYLHVYHRGEDYLDKPPLLFWLASASMQVFGINNFGYKFPAFLVLLLALFSTYHFTKYWYNQRSALLAAAILGTTHGFYLMTNDVRTDGLLTGFVIFAVWQISVFIHEKKYINLFLGSLGVAAAMLAKGPFGIVIVAIAIGSDLLLKRKWSDIFRWQWILMLLTIAVVLAPMTYGLYTQFDMHPEKTVYGLQGPSGVRFFYWTQSFGRITGEIYWNNHAGFFFFFHSILLDFLPWILFFIPALVYKFYQLWKIRFKAEPQQEFLTMGGFVLGFLMLSMSNYKLPHYIFSLFPFAAILTAVFLHEHFTSYAKWAVIWRKVQNGVLFILYVAIFMLFAFAFQNNWLVILVPAGLFVVFVYSLINTKDELHKTVLPTLITAVALGFVFSMHVYPNMLQYQSSSVVGREILKMNIPPDKFMWLNTESNSLDFYARRIVPEANSDSLPIYPSGTYIFATQKDMEEMLQVQKLDYKIVKSYPHFSVSKFNIKFLNAATRSKVLRTNYLLVKN